MFLGRQHLVERLKLGAIVVDPPPSDEDVDLCSVSLHLGTKFLLYPRFPEEGDRVRSIPWDIDQLPEKIHTVKPSGTFVLDPGQAALAATLEEVWLPFDLAGFLFLRPEWARFGLTTLTSQLVSPGFRGRFALMLSNNGAIPVALTTGRRMLLLCFAELSSSNGLDFPAPRFHFPDGPFLEAKAKLTSTTASPASRGFSDELGHNQELIEHLNQLGHARGSKEKGTALEKLAAALFAGVEGLRVIRMNARLRAEELDIVLDNDMKGPFFRMVGTPILVECKNWSTRVGAREISILVDKLRSIGPDTKLGILIALNGITGNSSADAILKIREARQHGRYILVMDHHDLEAIVRGASFHRVITEKYEDLLRI